MSNAYEVTGKVKFIGAIQTFGSGFTKREIVVTTAEEKYPQDIKIEFVKEGCDRLEAFKIGDTAKIAFNIKGNEYQGKYYVSLQGWKIGKEGASSEPPARANSQNGAKPPELDDFQEDDDIPF